MSEFLSPDNLELIKARLDRLRRTISRSVWSAIEYGKFKSRVDATKEEEHQQKAETFSAELLDFISQDISGLLGKLQPTKSQLALFYFLKEAAGDESVGTPDQLALESTHRGLYGPTGEAFLSKHYQAGSIESPTADLLTSLFWEKDRRFASYSANWSVDRDYPLSASCFGFIGREDAESIRFLFFEETPTSEQVLQTVGSHPSETVTADVYDAGKKIIVRVESTYQGKTYLYTLNYYLLGGFDGLKTGKKYLVYGTNLVNHTKREVVRERMSVGRPALATVTTS